MAVLPLLILASVFGNTLASTLISASALEEPCQFRPKGFAPGTHPDTPQAFQANPVYKNVSSLAKTPEGYHRMFDGLTSSVRETPETTFLREEEMTHYRPLECAGYCDQEPSCNGFNTFFRRDPEMKPGKDCPKPNSTVHFYCTLWTTTATRLQASNSGQTQEDFEVVIAGSNGYGKKPKVATSPEHPKSPKHGNTTGTRKYEASTTARITSATVTVEEDNNSKPPTMTGAAAVTDEFGNAYMTVFNQKNNAADKMQSSNSWAVLLSGLLMGLVA